MIGLKKKFAFDSDDVGFLTFALRSDGVIDGDDGCSDTPINNCKINCSVSNEINTGDTVYDGFSGAALFDGDNKFYNLYLAIWGSGDGTRVCKINNSGVITEIYSICTI